MLDIIHEAVPSLAGYSLSAVLVVIAAFVVLAVGFYSITRLMMALLGIDRCGSGEIPLAAFFIPTTLPDAVVGVPYVADTGGAHGTAPYAFAKLAGPAWLSVDPVTGALTGTPDATGLGTTVSVQVTDADMDTAVVTQTIDITAPLALTAFFNPAALLNGTVGVPYNAGTSSIHGDQPATYTKIAGPAWLNVDLNTGAITGTPDVIGAGITVTVRATDQSAATDDVTDTINVVEIVNLAAVFNPLALPDAQAGVAYVADTNATGGTLPYTFAKVAGPAWLSVNPATGAITGTPPAAATGVVVTVSVTDANSNYTDVTDTINVTPAAPPAPAALLVGGGFTTLGGGAHQRIAKLNLTTGAHDATFNPTADSQVNAVAKQADGKYLVGGGFTLINGTSRSQVARINADGTLDAVFNPPIPGGFTVRALGIRADNNVVAGGTFIGAISRVAVLDATTGALVAGFTPNVNGGVRSLVAQADGKIVIGGDFTTVDATSRDRVARLDSDGSLDATFIPPSFDNTVMEIAQQADGKTVVAGWFTGFIERLNTDGSLDAAFNPTPDSFLYAVQIQTDGKILIGGEFANVNGSARTLIARLNSDGTLDAGFNPVLSGSRVENIRVQPDGKILIGGFISLVNGVARNNFARLNADGTLDAAFSADTVSSVLDMVVV
jgi:uncharacterized delta-60 repeat protein